MKVFFWVALLGNFLLLALWQAGLFAGIPGTAPQIELNAASIRLVTAAVSEVESVASAVVEEEKPLPIAASAVVLTAPVSAVATTAEPNFPPVCMEWGEFSGAGLVKANKLLAGMNLGSKLSQRQIEHANGYWVYLGPLSDKQTVTQKLAQLKARGVEDYFVVQDDSAWNNTISLGVFKTEEAARNFLQELQGKDVKTAKVGEKAGKPKSTMFVFTAIDRASANRLAAMQKEFGDSLLKNVPCALTR
jgi:hypothetical protein